MNNDFLPGEDNSFSFRSKPVDPRIKAANWKAIEENIQAAAEVKPGFFKRYAMGIAASLLLLAVACWYLLAEKGTAPTFYQTAYSQVKHITLPDGSSVTLNANSVLRLSASWDDTGDRQVWLDGEAYFEVAKKPATHQKFVVHAKDMDVEVLGTRFNVNTRHAVSQVSLEEGKVRLAVKSNVLRKKATKEITEMVPGELVKLDTAAGVIIRKESSITNHSGWVRNEFHFNNTSLREIMQLVKDVYGYNMEVSDEQLLDRAVSGDLRAASLKELVEVLQLTFRLKMTVDNKTIRISQP